VTTNVTTSGDDTTHLAPARPSATDQPAGLGAEALLLDLDGTLVDSTPALQRSWLRWADEYAITHERLRGVVAHGLTADAIVRALLPPGDVAAAQKRIDELEVADVDGVVALPGAVGLLASLPAERWTIVTSGKRVVAEARLRAAGVTLPAVMVTADDVVRGKPDPEPYLLGAARLGVEPERCLVVEDAPAGLASGRAAGMHTVGVATTHDAVDLDADLVVGSLLDLRVDLRGDHGLDADTPAVTVGLVGSDARLRRWPTPR
jgi:mannitol-1-/sugar-/sorbitol-6-phosphatase